MSDGRIECAQLWLAPVPSGQAFELIALQPPPPTAFPQGWPVRPGSAHRDASGRPTVLYCASNRWLIPAADPTLEALIADALASRAYARIDVTGKWQAFRLSGPAARRALASTMDVEAALDGVDCASVTLFDCPAVLSRSDAEYWIWVQRSFAAAFVSALRSQLATLGAAGRTVGGAEVCRSIE